MEIKKLDPAQNLVFGWASVAITVDGETVIDKQGDIIPTDELEQAAYDFVLKWREADSNHDRITKGHVVESLVVTPEKLEALGLPAGSLQTGWWVGFKVDPATFAKVQSGEFQMFSIEGTAQRVEVEKYSPDQAREPGGKPEGGRFAGGSTGTTEQSAAPSADFLRGQALEGYDKSRPHFVEIAPLADNGGWAVRSQYWDRGTELGEPTQVDTQFVASRKYGGWAISSWQTGKLMPKTGWKTVIGRKGT